MAERSFRTPFIQTGSLLSDKDKARIRAERFAEIDAYLKERRGIFRDPNQRTLAQWEVILGNLKGWSESDAITRKVDLPAPYTMLESVRLRLQKDLTAAISKVEPHITFLREMEAADKESAALAKSLQASTQGRQNTFVVSIGIVLVAVAGLYFMNKRRKAQYE